MIETIPSGTILNGRYCIERVLGSGGFGHVYLAIDVVTSQSYAVKEYLVTGESGQEQLKHEASVLSHLRHPNLPAFQDAFIERERYYVVINYIEGNDLTDLIRMVRQHNDIIPIARILSWIIAICNAVKFLHQQQPIIIHRDIKPDNIRIMPSGTAVLVDLGNAKAAADGARTLLFIRHQGTPGYAPPEQYPGGAGTDARSDIYALGATLYFALTAHEPPSVSVRNQSLQQGRPTLPSLQECLVNNPPEENSQTGRQFRLSISKPGKGQPRHSYHIAQLGSLPPQLLNQLNAIIQKAMELSPRNRYMFVADLAEDLQRIAKLLPTPPTQEPDAHSTQPDLDDLYQAVQAYDAKAKTIPEQPFMSAQSSTATCANCGASLLSKAAFCPHCGTSVRQPNGRQQMSMINMNDISGEQTLLMKPSQFSQAVAVRMGKKTPVTNTPSALPLPPNISPVPPTPIIMPNIPVTQLPQQNGQTQPKMQDALLSRLKNGRNLTILLIILLLATIIAIIAIIWIINH